MAMDWPLIVVDCLLALGLTARLTRFVVTDDLGGWWIREPAQRWANRHEPTVNGVPVHRAVESGAVHADGPVPRGWRDKLVSGLDCPFCVGFWLAALVLASLAVVGGPGADSLLAVVWRWVAAVFALNWVAAHLGARLGDAGGGGDND